MDLNYELLERTLYPVQRYDEYLEKANDAGCKYLSLYLVRQYFDNRISAIKIAKELEANQAVWIYTFFKRHNLIVRPIGTPYSKIEPDDSYEDVDKKLNLKFSEEKTETAEQLGFKTVSEAVVDLYYQQRFTLTEIGAMFNVSGTWTSLILRKMNRTLRKKGGKTYSKLTDQMKSKIIKDLEDTPPTWINIKEYLEIEEIELSPKTIQRFLKEMKLCQATQDFRSKKTQ
jgi:transposase